MLVLLQVRTCNNHYTIVNHSRAVETHFIMVPSSDTLRLDRRRAAIVAAARELFVAQGYETTTLAEIAARAGGSLATVYKLFGNKDGLLEAVILESVASGESLVRDADAARMPPAETLRRIAKGLHAQFLDPDVIALVRIVIARSICDPPFARQFFERTANRTGDAIAAMFVRWQSEGVVMNGTPTFLAEMFMGLFVSDLQTQAISHGVAVSPETERLRDRTDFFIAAAGLGSGLRRVTRHHAE